MGGQQPAGWYPSPDPTRRASHARYWDGIRWTEHEMLIEDILGPAEPVANESAAKRPEVSGPEIVASGRGRRLLARSAVVLLIAAFVLPLAGAWFERANASGPVLFTLEDQTRWNDVINPPQLVVASGESTDRRTLAVSEDGSFLRIPDLVWTLDAPLRLELVPDYPSEESGQVVIDLYDNGARRLAQGWAVQVRIVATDQAFELIVSQPVVDGIQRSRELVHRSSIPRSNERRLVAVIAAEAEAIASQQACAREEIASRSDLTQPTVSLSERYQSSVDFREVYGQIVEFDTYRRSIRNLASDMQSHLRDAERALERLADDPFRREFDGAIDAYGALRDAWLSAERALQTARSQPGSTLEELYPDEFGTVRRLENEMRTNVSSAKISTTRQIGAIAAAICEELHPLP